ncbi:co-chaperone GroES [Fusobacterium mortiferum]|jgi:chaperonin GroES|uniref:Co-chaperonin GroES n=2 Tax=Fusobacterium TaxID=848 RepID=A0ABS2G2V8_FUSMR|nr:MULTISPECIES: co-chaperone GroES [Fusobacterium]MBU3842472.1 co-chaperone GroES [Candidatus Fusobacterium pullicola]MBM6690584.1 co-chaperone GroES [Fusobacterium mortiferum]MBM6822070.1 co-chaperone GroES [Fusobacterium mortiferum]MBM6875540.1 co-chaperone GroES [Fusobacterium mortiferum]MDO5788859.1 co-chaperone GroES [Fusobacterium sp.]
MKIRPIGERVLVKPVKVEEKTASGIILPGAGEKERPNIAEVIAVGKGEKLEDIKVGERVVYSKFSGTEIKDGEEKYIVLNIEDVLAVIE